ncbi:hypothetical protein Pcinc_031315 [Petrolisthes cinctipes]|uniref:OCIA domain-containing protein n=1 Tax=Petrolisthes cinctipes TaxID=88211 RepID=A0AAE1EWD1_PETCI|nr:hypothetical protein Pcinc_031315 [Petrolisthes cinctipes]
MTQPTPPGSYDQQGQQEQQFRPGGFNQEELRVLRECNRESFYYRCVPMAALCSAGAFIAMKRGMLKTSERFGYTPKMIGGVIIGYFLGKLSYQNACAEKLMQLPNSPIGEALRKRKGRMGFQETLGFEPGFTVADPSASTTNSSLYEDPRVDLRDHNEGQVEYERGVTESLSAYTKMDDEEGGPGAPQSYTNYQELRRNNRHEYISKMAERYRRDRPGDQPTESGGPSFGVEEPPLGSIPPVPSTPSPPPTRSRKNKYGDEVYE